MTFLLLMLVGIISSGLNICDGAQPEQSSQEADTNRLLLILLDGFRHDYLLLPGLNGFPRFRRQGVQAEYMEAVYPAESYPGYYAIATGRYAESHGMVLNYMYDQTKDTYFLMEPHRNASHPFWWEEAEPVWITAARVGVPVGMFLWPGGGVNIHNYTAAIVKPYEWKQGVEAFREDLHTALLHLQNRNLQLAMVYCEHTDIIGHRHGPQSTDLHTAVVEVDLVLNEMLDKIEIMGLKKSLHIVIVSDHGMTAGGIHSVKNVYLRHVLDPDDITLVLGRGSHSGIYPKEGREDKVVNDLKKLEGVDVYLRDQIPDNLHFKKNARVPPVFIIVQKGYFLHGMSEKQVPPESSSDFKGLHGYDPAERDMRAIFLASGPELKRDFTSPPIIMTDPYQLMTHFLRIPTQPNNGSWDRVSMMLHKHEEFTPLVNHFAQRKVRVELVWGMVVFSYSFCRTKD